MVDRLLIGWHRLVAGMLDVVGRLRALPTAQRDARIDELPVAAIFTLGGRDLSGSYWERRSTLGACGCMTYRGHVVLYAFECEEHDSGFREPAA